MGQYQSDAVLTVREVADYLKIGESTVYRLVRNNELPGRKVGGSWRFSRQGIDDWLRQKPWPEGASPR